MMTPQEILLLKEAIDLLDNGLDKLLTIESNHPSLVALLSMLHSSITFSEKILSMYEAV